MTEKNRRSLTRVILAVMLAVGNVIAIRWALSDPVRVTEVFRPASRAVCRVMSKVTGVLPFSLIEVLLILTVLAFLVSLGWLAVTLIRRKGRLSNLGMWFSHWLLFAGCVLTLFMGMWGLNYFGTDMADELGLEVKPRSSDELYEVTKYVALQANHYGSLVERNENLVAVAPEFSQVSDACLAAYDKKASEHEFFYISGGQAKPVMNWYAMSKMGITGIYIALTGECNVNTDITAANLPFTTAHELAHRMGVAPENEASFTAYLALRDCGDDYLTYSAYYSAFIYCYNALYKVDKEAAAEIASILSDEVRSDINEANERYRSYEGKVRKVSQSVNDTYLKTMQQPSGVQSYGQVVDLIIADYYK